MTATQIHTTAPYFNQIGWSDVTPFEVVRVVSDKTVEVRRMDAERDESWTPTFVSGGFAGVCTNTNEQRWIITSNTANETVRVRLQKDGSWKDKYQRRFRPSDTAIRHYDYNF